MRGHGRRTALAATLVAASLIGLSACGGGSPGPPSSAGSRIGQVVPDGPAPTDQAITGATADSGFRPQANGFTFANYGNDVGPQNLTAAEVRDIFGDGVCANTTNGCELIPPAQAWMDSMNKQMAGGHCFGFSVTAMLMFQGKIDAGKYGASSVKALQIQGNLPLQQRIAESMSYQFLDAVQGSSVFGAPNDILTKLAQVLTANPTELYTIGIVNRQQKGGHAVTPFALEDMGNGITDILIYDNNWPDTIRAIEVDTNANTWKYQASTNPSQPADLYDGDATTQSMWLIPTLPATTKQPCPFCGAAQQAAFAAPTSEARLASLQEPRRGRLSDAAVPSMDLSIDWFSDDAPAITVRDSNGGAVERGPAWTQAGRPVAHPVISGHDYNVAGGEEYKLPAGVAYSITLDGSGMAAAASGDLDLLAAGRDLQVNSVTIDPGKTVTIDFSADATTITYTADDPSPPTFVLGSDGATDDGEISLTPRGISAGDALAVDLGPASLSIDDTMVNETLTYDLSLTTLDTRGQTTFHDSTVDLPAHQDGTLDWAADTPEHPEQTLTLTKTGGSTETLDNGG